MIPNVKLNTGASMPAIGLGTWKMNEGSEAESAVRLAIEAGYRLIDTARLYGNERSVGKAVRASGLKREELFVTTKLWPTDFFDPQKAFDESLSRLDIGYIDLYLIHWPIPLMPRSVWQSLERIYQSGKAKAIGVSNYGRSDIEKVLEYCIVPPAVNQIKFSPFDFEKDTLECCKEHDILVEAYSPLTHGSNLGDKTILEIAARYHKSPAQIMLRWCVQRGTVPLPKSSNPERIRENLQIFDFELSPEDMQTLDRLS
ncbi:MAG: aldo/keto reductase [Candidatus Pacebacteria bacterium]|nr:aldo/keto reductase [Candidatus Paceibacterota bacterium]